MKQFYYFSKNKLKFVEIKNFYRKFIFLVLFFSILISFFVFGTFFVVNEIINPNAEVTKLQAENRALLNKLKISVDKYKDLSNKFNELANKDNSLRLAVNLEPIDFNSKLKQIGGRSFKEIPIANSEEAKKIVNQLDSVLQIVDLQVNYVRNNYSEISRKIKINKKLYEALPAIKPANGPIGDKFGMRKHPILKIWRMHEGIDILVNTGSPVYAAGAGIVSFVGRRGGYGRVVVINHGFGYTTLYAHLKKWLVKKGQHVKRGDKIALSGDSGRLSTGPHLHYEVRHNGIPLNPMNFIYDDINLFDVVARK